MLNRAHLVLLLACGLFAAAACSRSDAPEQTLEDEPSAASAPKADDALILRVRAAAHALSQPEPSVDYVAAEMEGVIMARTRNQALIHYDGYRATLTTPTDRVTRIVFLFTEAKPRIGQLTGEFGAPKPTGRGMLYELRSATTGAVLEILAEPVALPFNDDSLVRRIIIEGARTH
ncbi:MAG: hypothetical protein WCE62_09550 [Polyangiales bacterium]